MREGDTRLCSHPNVSIVSGPPILARLKLCSWLEIPRFTTPRRLGRCRGQRGRANSQTGPSPSGWRRRRGRSFLLAVTRVGGPPPAVLPGGKSPPTATRKLCCRCRRGRFHIIPERPVPRRDGQHRGVGVRHGAPRAGGLLEEAEAGEDPRHRRARWRSVVVARERSLVDGNGMYEPGMVVRKLFRIAFAFTLFLKAHCIASHRIRIAFAFCIRIALFAYLSHLRTLFTFLVVILQLMHIKFVKSAKKCAKYTKKCENAKKCEKLRKANAMRKCNQNSHRIALHYCGENFSHFFASHRTTILGTNSFRSVFVNDLFFYILYLHQFVELHTCSDTYGGLLKFANLHFTGLLTFSVEYPLKIYLVHSYYFIYWVFIKCKCWRTDVFLQKINWWVIHP